MEADVTDCTMGNTFTMAVTDLLSSLNLEDSDDLDELQDLSLIHIYVRATQNSIGSNVETLYHILDGKAEALEFKICDNSPIVGRTLSELNLKKNLLVGCLYRDGSVRIPRGHDALEIGDRVVIVTTNRGLRDINDILAK